MGVYNVLKILEKVGLIEDRIVFEQKHLHTIMKCAGMTLPALVYYSPLNVTVPKISVLQC